MFHVPHKEYTSLKRFRHGNTKFYFVRRILPACNGRTLVLGMCAEEYFHGTGDTFSAALLAGLLNGQNLETAAQTAAYFTSRCIQRTAEAQVPEREGLCFEKELLWLGSRLQNLNNDTDNYTK